MVAPTIKEPTDADPGDSTKWGAPDAVHAAKLLKGTHATEKIQKEAIENTAMTLADAQTVTSRKTFNDNTFSFFNPAGTFRYNHRTAAIVADRRVDWPLLVADDEVVLKNHSVALINKSIDADQNTITNIENADIKAAAGIVYSKLALTDSIVNADINSAAAIAFTKMAALTASRALETNGSGVVVASSVTSTELGYVSGVTSAIQTQLNAKASLTGAENLTNKGVNFTKILGFTYENVTLSSDAAAGTASRIAIDAEGAGTTDTLSTITGYADGDIVGVVAQASQVITVTHDIGGTNAIHLAHKINIRLSEKVPLILERRGGEWYELSGPVITKIALYYGKPGDNMAVADNVSVHFCDMAGLIIKVKGVVDTVSSSGVVTMALRKNSTDVLSTNITIDANETSSETAATPPVIKSDGSEIVAKDDILRADCDGIGTGSKGGIQYVWIENLSGE